jgi:hypothetical protein
MQCCPYCGFYEFYVVTKMHGVGQTNHRFDGECADNSELHTCLNYKDNKTAYCSQCYKKLGKFEDCTFTPTKAAPTKAAPKLSIYTCPDCGDEMRPCNAMLWFKCLGCRTIYTMEDLEKKRL